jgi:DNA-binding NarL/FixJ family response regulator
VLSVLLVDDDAAFRRLAGQLLARVGLDVVGEAGTVAAAVSAARRLTPRAVLVDIGLPDGDGLTVARELTALPWRPQVVLTSGDPDAATAEEVRLSGAAGFVPKHELPGRVVDLLLAAK